LLTVNRSSTPLGRMRLQTKFLLSMILVSSALTFTTLYVVRRNVQQQVRLEIFRNLDNSVSTFRNFERQREITLERSAALLADLPDVRALMTSHHAATIQDASQHLWKLAGSDLLLLADSSGQVMALQVGPPEVDLKHAREFFPQIVASPQTRHWWYVEGHLYEVFLQDIYFGREEDGHILGYLGVGYEIDDRVAHELRQVAASEVVFHYGDTIVRSTLPPAQESALQRTGSEAFVESTGSPGEIKLVAERFLTTSIELAPARSGLPPLRLSVLKSFDQATAFLSSLNQLLLALGLTAVVGGSILVYMISHTITRPLGSLVQGVRALEGGDFDYPLESQGDDEVAELTRAFDGMRKSLQKTQRELLDAERLATIGRMASSISHDLRHSLAAIVANAEFLCETHLTPGQREDLYAEVRIAVNQMTDLIESLLEFSRTRESLRTSVGDVRDAVQHAIQALKAHPEFHTMPVSVTIDGSTEGLFDFRKLERALLNLLVNACEAAPAGQGRIEVALQRVADHVEIRISDNGPGIAEGVREHLFEPFVSYGKENGTGMGLTVVQKIVQDHGGDVIVERSSSAGTTFKITLPLHSSSEKVMAIRSSP
jgi:signal transduction histidine kinase